MTKDQELRTRLEKRAGEIEEMGRKYPSWSIGEAQQHAADLRDILSRAEQAEARATQAEGREKVLREALEKIIAMNVQYAIDRFGDAEQAESMACVTTARSALSTKGGGEGFIASGVPALEAAAQDAADPGEPSERCIACGLPLLDGQFYYPDVDGGYTHAECSGPEREGYVNADGEPLADDEPIPAASVWVS